MPRADELKLDVPDGEYDLPTPWAGMIKHESKALVASSFPVKPPKTWFENPKFRELTPLSIGSDGRVSGHIAGWRTNHIGMSAGTKPPRSKSGYAFFQTGALETNEGDIINVGQITLAGGHAPLDVSTADAVAHYDDTKSAVMDVTCGEDRHGIWVAGALRPTVDDVQLRSIRASSVSGDWRPINGRLELVAVCAVNCPGFPIPRARVAGGAPVALVAAGTGPIVQKIIADMTDKNVDSALVAGIDALHTRLSRLEEQVFKAPAARPARKNTAKNAERPVRAAAVRRKKKPLTVAQAAKARAARKSVDSAKNADEPDPAAIRAAALRERMQKRREREAEAEAIVAAAQERRKRAQTWKLRKQVQSIKQEALVASLRARAHKN